MAIVFQTNKSKTVGNTILNPALKNRFRVLFEHKTLSDDDKLLLTRQTITCSFTDGMALAITFELPITLAYEFTDLLNRMKQLDCKIVVELLDGNDNAALTHTFSYANLKYKHVELDYGSRDAVVVTTSFDFRGSSIN